MSTLATFVVVVLLGVIVAVLAAVLRSGAPDDEAGLAEFRRARREFGAELRRPWRLLRRGPPVT